MNQLISLCSRILFFGAAVLAILAICEKLANLMDMTLLRGTLPPFRLLELAVVALLFVIAMQLRESRSGPERN